MSDTMQGAGWWQASDGRWYPPAAQPPPAQPPPAQPPAAPQPPSAPARAPSPGGGFPRRWAAWQVALAALAALLVGVGIGAASAGGDDDGGEQVATGAAADPTDEDRDETTTTAERTTTTSSEVGTRDDPVPVGQVVTLEDQGSPSWEVKVTGFIPDGTQAVLAENQFNDPPAAGRQFALVTVEATYIGTEQTSTPLAGMSFSAVDAGNVSYDFDDDCGVIPTPLDHFGDVFEGGVVSGNLCWSVDTAQVDSLLLIVEPAISFDAEPTFLALR